VTRPELEPGYGEPTTPDEVEHLLHFVPDVVFEPELVRSVPRRPSGAAAVTMEAVDAEADAAFMEAVRAALEHLHARARLEERGGLAFLARTLLHFLDIEPIAPSQHPLVVALFLRAEAAAGRMPDTPAAISRAMDRF
jgi:hypothetical protein